MVEIDEANDVATATATIAMEQVFAGINEKAGLPVGVQRTQSQKAAGADRPGLLPIVSLQILQQCESAVSTHRERDDLHGLLASIGRIRQNAPRSQARMVGVRKRRSA